MMYSLLLALILVACVFAKDDHARVFGPGKDFGSFEESGTLSSTSSTSSSSTSSSSSSDEDRSRRAERDQRRIGNYHPLITLHLSITLFSPLSTLFFRFFQKKKRKLFFFACHKKFFKKTLSFYHIFIYFHFNSLYFSINHVSNIQFSLFNSIHSLFFNNKTNDFCLKNFL